VEKRLRVLAVTKLFPSAANPLFAPFNRQQFAALARVCDVDVMGVIPWFPGARWLSRWSSAGFVAGAPREETFDGLRVSHPRFLFVPRVGRFADPVLYVASLWPHVRRYRGLVDVVLGAWAFPDGVAAVQLARMLGVPAVVKVQGSDLNVLPRTRSIAMWLARALPRAARVVAVSAPLAEKARGFGVSPERIKIVRNGVDRELFSPRSRHEARVRLGLSDGRWLLFVGNVLETKGVRPLLDAFAEVAREDPTLRLAIVGDGPLRPLCEEAARGCNGRIVVTGRRPLDELGWWYGAADVVVLPSFHEGTPNVVLEAQVVGRPVVATSVGGIPDLLSAPGLGVLVPPRDHRALAAGLREALAGTFDETAIAARAPGGWDESAAALLDVLREAACKPPGGAV
jgi:glycosyltransferase involved in cell wall biosynthesis